MEIFKSPASMFNNLPSFCPFRYIYFTIFREKNILNKNLCKRLITCKECIEEHVDVNVK